MREPCEYIGLRMFSAAYHCIGKLEETATKSAGFTIKVPCVRQLFLGQTERVSNKGRKLALEPSREREKT